MYMLLTLAFAGESPTCIVHEGAHPVTRASIIRSLQSLALIKKSCSVDLTAEVHFSFF